MQEFLSLFVNVYYLIGSIAITFFAMKFAFEQMQGNAGLIGIVSRVLGFVIMFLVLMLAMPALFEFGVNRSMAHMQNSQISRNVITLTKDTAELLAQQDSNIELVEASDDTLADAATELYEEVQTQRNNRNATAPQSNGATQNTNVQAAPQTNVQAAPVQRPLVLAPEYLTATPLPLVLKAAGNQVPTPVVGAPSVPLMLMEAADPTPDGGGPGTYTVAGGDSLAKIAAKYGVSVDALCRANDLRNCNVIAKGKKLVIP